MRILTTERCKGSGRRRRVAWAGTFAGLALLISAGPAASLDRSSNDLTGVTITCGDDILTFTGGVQVGGLHRVLLGNGAEVVLLNVVLHDATLSDSAGATYRAVGGANSTARVATQDGAESLAGHFNVNFTVLDHRGRFGKALLRERTSRDGSVDLVTGGGCLP